MARTCRQYIPAGDGAVCKEEDPDTVPPVTVFRDDFVLVTDPVLVPAVDGGRIVNAKNIDVLDLETSAFQLEKRLNLVVCIHKDVSHTLPITQPREQDASAPGKMYLFMKRPLGKA